jgi:hypothetical protein
MQRRYEVARRFETDARVHAIAAPGTWKGLGFTDVGELATLAAAPADPGRLLGRLPVS